MSRETEWLSPEIKGMLSDKRVLGISFKSSENRGDVQDISFCIWEEGSPVRLKVPFGIKGRLELAKEGSDGRGLKDVVFTAVHKETGERAELKTGEDGGASADGLTCGIWEITEQSGAVSYTHLDVYKRQAENFVFIYKTEFSFYYTGGLSALSRLAEGSEREKEKRLNEIV